MSNLNVLSERYATPEINDIFSERGRIILERELWIAVMKAQRELGLNIPIGDIGKFHGAIEDVDLDFIRKRELETRHDVKAKIEAFIKVSGAREHIHKGITSRDLTDNVEQMQIKNASETVLGRYVSVLRHFVDKAKEYDNLVITARTHHQPAQPTLLGRRFSMWAEELMFHLNSFETFIDAYPLRGIKGPVGTQFDMLTLLGDINRVDYLEKMVADELGFKEVLNSPGQVYPRSLDSSLVSHLSLLGSACENFAKSMRLMAGYELVEEGFKEGQVGSSAMPYKMNTRSSERICSLAELLKMYADGASRLAGDQWEEGDVSCSALRRIIIPDAFYASDGLCETTLTVLNEMGVYPRVIEAEIDRYLPFMATTEILAMAVKNGVGREEVHKAIKKYTTSEALRMRKDGSKENRVAELLASDPVFVEAEISEQDMKGILQDRTHFIGNARNQIDQVITEAERFISRYEREAKYEPREIL